MKLWIAKFIGAVLLGGTLALGGTLVLTFGRPPQPLAFGRFQWIDETGFTVTGVERTDRIAAGGRSIRAKGQFYIVHGLVICPFGYRAHWRDDAVEVRTFAGTGGTMHDLRFSVDEAAQALLDRRTGRPGPRHEVLGASQHEDLVFDLPRNVEQPGLVFIPGNEAWGLLDWLFGRPWQPHRFNLRYD